MRDAPTARWRRVPDLELLRARPADERRRAVDAYRRDADGRALEVLGACLFDDDVDVAYDAARALGGIGNDEAVARLVDVACDERCAVVRRIIALTALSIAKRVPEDTVGALRALAGTRDPWLASTARTALAQLGRR